MSQGLILVDAPATEAPSTASSSSLPRFHLRFPVSNNRGGLVLPQLLDTAERSLFECLRRFLSHAWHFDILLVDGTHTIAPETFLYLLVTSTWETNLQNLTRDIKRISFEEVRKPNAAINDVLHDRRKDLIFLREQVALGKSWIPRSVAEQLQAIQAAAEKQQIHVGFPHERLGDVLVQAQSLERFLMDSFSLLISSTIVLQATLSTEQAVRGQKLTQLAFLYIPLSFVTGVFGMNVREINGSPLSIWVPVVVLGVTLVLTAAIFTSHGWWERRFVRRI
ncbi:uncharacterized protein K489DRAFT_125641 [Dissoconium aciculare CBS 342.82]|uniref:Mg2+ transporter protein n=1 Tax=Dissoconium aciculare CBS 342.82 TaxID=1314786 RepID=A0A6J3MIR2_9PEZI|nr:uncharacterized protein K489DRAFT_125641 [Dissoconium aciculare CBS 342.82]KAF1826802.1 hypothetical protein K489DRAFT_125641 [Dissoconium aciculare CBS 342.82]